MKHVKFLITTLIVLHIIVVQTIIHPTEVHAYLDPGSGSYITQIVVASLLGVGFIVSSFWSKIKNVLRTILKTIFGAAKKEAKGDED